MSSGVLRVCYRGDHLPFTYFNGRDEFVGFDVEMIDSLARGLDLKPEFVPLPAIFGGERLADSLDSGYCDLSVSRLAISMTWLGKVAYSKPYLDLTLAFLVEDYRRREFSRREIVEANRGLRIAIPNDPYYMNWARTLLPNANIIPVADIETFISADEDQYDAMLYVGEALAAYTLLNPRFGVAVPKPGFPSIPAAYAIPRGESDWREVVDAWIELKRTDGTVQQLFDYWILGKDAEKHAPRWSVVRDVLHWTD
jgi:ABC-type amino acid transport substrate-binding protein